LVSTQASGGELLGGPLTALEGAGWTLADALAHACWVSCAVMQLTCPLSATPRGSKPTTSKRRATSAGNLLTTVKSEHELVKP
jgi:hypothetical protein